MADLDYLFNPIVAVGTVAGLAGVVLLATLAVFWRPLLRRYARFALPAMLTLAVAGTVASLFYEYALHYIPCFLCWWQRIFLYPQVVLLAIALWRHDRNVWITSIALSILGTMFAFYQSLLQVGLAPNLGCASAGGPDCAARVVLGLGFVTIPVMALVGFALLIALALISRMDTSGVDTSRTA